MDRMHPVSVSVVIPTFNRCSLVQQAIDSALAQTYPDIEIIVVDDGSTDETPRIIPAKYGDQIRYIWQENAGLSAARNHGLRLAQGEYVAFLDSDDLWLPEKLRRQVAEMEKHPEAGAVLTQARYIDINGKVLNGRYVIGGKISPDDLTWQKQIFRALPCGGSTALIRRDAFLKMGGFREDIHYGEDGEAWLRFATQYSVLWQAEPLALIRTHVGAQGKLLAPAILQNKLHDRFAILESIDAITGYTLDREAVDKLKIRLRLTFAFQALAIPDPFLAAAIIAEIPFSAMVQEQDLTEPLQTVIAYLKSGSAPNFTQDFIHILEHHPVLRQVPTSLTFGHLALMETYGQTWQRSPLARLAATARLLLHHPTLLIDSDFNFILKHLLAGK